MKNSGIYIIRNKINSKFYIGSSCDIKKRWRRHRYDLNRNGHHNIYLQRAWNKYGKCNFEFEIILEEDNDVNLFKIEQKLLDGYFGMDDCYNVSPHPSGGDLLTNHPNRDKIIKKIANGVRKRNKNMSKQERIDKWGKFGKNNSNYGNKWPQSSRKRLSEYQKNRLKDPEERRKISERQKNRFRDPEERRKMSEMAKLRTGDKNPFYGKKHSEKTKKQISDKNKGKYMGGMERPVIIDGVWYKSVSEAARQIGVVAGTIIHRIKSKNKKFEGYLYEKQKIGTDGSDDI